jgi:hypothetical protein
VAGHYKLSRKTSDEMVGVDMKRDDMWRRFLV